MKNSKQLLFERMHTIGGMPLNEEIDVNQTYTDSRNGNTYSGEQVAGWIRWFLSPKRKTREERANAVRLFKAMNVDPTEYTKKRVRNLSPNASIENKIQMWDLIRSRAYDFYHNTNKHDEVFWQKMWDKYGYPWQDLYDEIRDTPEFEVFRKKNNIADNLTFDDSLA